MNDQGTEKLVCWEHILPAGECNVKAKKTITKKAINLNNLMVIILLLCIAFLSCCTMFNEDDITRTTPSMLPEATKKIQKAVTVVNKIQIKPLPQLPKTTELTTLSQCTPEKTVIYNGIVYEYFWSMDNHSIYFAIDKKKEDWFAFDFASQSTRPASESERMRLSKLTLWDRLLLEYYTNEIEIDWSRIYYSPSSEYAIFTKEIEVGTPQPPGVKEMFAELLISQEGSENPEYLGKVKGLVSDVFWTREEHKAIVVMQQYMSAASLSEYHIWIVDIAARSLTPFFPREDSNLIDIGGISDDGQWFFYYTWHGKFFHIRNIYTNQDEEIPLNDRLFFLGASDENNVFLSDLGNDTTDKGVFVYSFIKKELHSLKHAEFQPSPWAHKNVLLSPDHKNIAYSTVDGHLYSINLCESQW